MPGTSPSKGTGGSEGPNSGLCPESFSPLGFRTSGCHGQDSNKENRPNFGPVYSVLLGFLYTCSLIRVKMGDIRKSPSRDFTKAKDRSLDLI